MSPVFFAVVALALAGYCAGNVICLDGQSECADGSTCCKLSTGQWGCCPSPNAVCCSGGRDCPSGHTCDVSAGACRREVEVGPQLAKQPTLTAPDVRCSYYTYCDAGKTCCHVSVGGYGCCPFPNAVCCSNGKTCCPAGETCAGDGRCIGMVAKVFLPGFHIGAKQGRHVL